ncbi:hypothetical protein PBAL39_04998 [Pedobacter sp. BAL39]|uniref:acyltransferase n=1 Tax=Pedobacter sp. BAL39 TaxID=391596 RepID=UPI00015593EA|nr:acyltransferase [Pedobacter sp. BAL39]EDM37128.1 hypothetical protein PBAL39_04998 [Pedobacter sp. BAL39]
MDLKLNNIYRIFRARLAGISISKGVQLERNVMFHLHSPFFEKPSAGKIQLMDEVKISTGTVIHSYGGAVNLGKETFIGPYVVIYGHGNVDIGKYCLISMHTCIVSSNHTIPGKDRLIKNEPDLALPVTIHDDVWIGANCTILGGVNIGKGAVIGAGSIVNIDIPEYAVAVGNPVRIIRYRD